MNSEDSRKQKFSKLWPYLAFFLVIGWYQSFKYFAPMQIAKPSTTELSKDVQKTNFETTIKEN